MSGKLQEYGINNDGEIMNLLTNPPLGTTTLPSLPVIAYSLVLGAEISSSVFVTCRGT
jgi:hypothetical protein